MTRGLRFAPPPATVSAEAAWLLRAAFPSTPASHPPAPRAESPAAAGPDHAPLAGLPETAGLDPAVLADLADRLDLGPRIAARWPAAELTTAAGAELAARLDRRRRRAVAAALLYETVAAEIAAAAAELDTPLIVLKGFALHLHRVGPPGARPFTDLDLLAAAGPAARLHRRLLERGYREAGAPANDQHLSPLHSPQGGVVDLHFRIRGLRLPGTAGWATADQLLAADLCPPAPTPVAGARLPHRELLAAHALAHGIEQHGHRPASYPLLRMIADLADLLPSEADRRRFRGNALAWIAGQVSPPEADAALDLTATLTAGHLPDPHDPDQAGAATLLAHALAGALDPGYREALRLTHASGRLAAARRHGRLPAYLAGKLLLSRAEVRLRYGEPATRWGYLRRQLLRPLELLLATTRAAAARLRLALRRKPPPAR